MDLTPHTLSGFLGRLHPAVIHFPIAILAVATLLEGLQVRRRTPSLSPATPILTAVAALGAVVSSVFGLLLKNYEVTEGTAVALHGWAGFSATVMALVAAASIAAASSRPWAVWCVRGALAAGTAIALGAGYLGGELVFGPNHLFLVFEPKAPKDPKPPAVPTDRAEIKKPDVAQGTAVDFEREVAPVLRNSCLKCHGPGKQKGRFRLDQREAAFRGGEDGPAILPGDRAGSPLFKLLIDKDPHNRMPQKAGPLPADQIDLLGRWIDQGAPWPAGVVVN